MHNLALQRLVNAELCILCAAMHPDPLWCRNQKDWLHLYANLSFHVLR